MQAKRQWAEIVYASFPDLFEPYGGVDGFLASHPDPLERVAPLQLAPGTPVLGSVGKVLDLTHLSSFSHSSDEALDVCCGSEACASPINDSEGLACSPSSSASVGLSPATASMAPPREDAAVSSLD